MKQIIIGNVGTGKSRMCVKNAVLKYAGKIILINTYDATKYLGLDKIGLRTVPLENANEIEDFEKVQVVVPFQSDSAESKELLHNFIKKHMDDDNTLLIIEETYNIAFECVPLIMSTENLKADVLMIFQSERHFEECSGITINRDACFRTMCWD